MSNVISRRILLLRLSSFGDIVLTEPVTSALKCAFPDKSIWFLTKEEYSDLVKMFTNVDHVIPFSKDRSLKELVREAGGSDFDLVIDLQNSFRSRMITQVFKAQTTIRYTRQWLRRLILVHLPWLWRGRLMHTVDLYSRAIARLGLETYSLPTIVPPTSVVESVSSEYNQGRWIGLCPGGSSPHKQWGQERFAVLADLLKSEGWDIVIIGSPVDRSEIAATVQKVGDKRVRQAIEEDMTRLAALLSLCEAVVTNDSGLMHLTAAVGTPVLAIFGPTSPLLGFSPVAPWSIVVYRDLKCSPCSYHGNRPCKYRHRECLDSIEPQVIASLVSQMVKPND